MKTEADKNSESKIVTALTNSCLSLRDAVLERWRRIGSTKTERRRSARSFSGRLARLRHIIVRLGLSTYPPVPMKHEATGGGRHRSTPRVNHALRTLASTTHDAPQQEPDQPSVMAIPSAKLARSRTGPECRPHDVGDNAMHTITSAIMGGIAQNVSAQSAEIALGDFAAGAPIANPTSHRHRREHEQGAQQKAAAQPQRSASTLGAP